MKSTYLDSPGSSRDDQMADLGDRRRIALFSPRGVKRTTAQSKAVAYTQDYTCLEQIAAYNRDLYCTHTAVGGRVAPQAPTPQTSDRINELLVACSQHATQTPILHSVCTRCD